MSLLSALNTGLQLFMWRLLIRLTPVDAKGSVLKFGADVGEGKIFEADRAERL